MRKITLILFTMLAAYAVKAQDSCASAVAVSTGITSVGTINGSEEPQPICAANGQVPITSNPAGEWYTFTPAQDGVYRVSSDLPQNDGILNSDDTRVHIYTGTCSNLTCAVGNDDVDGTNFLSLAYINATAGVTYYLAWDNRWSSVGFDFEIVLEPNLSCSDIDTFPYSQDWNNTTDPSGDSAFKWSTCWANENFSSGAGWTFNGANDFDGDGFEDNIINVFPQTTPAPAKNAWAISPGILMNVNSTYDITITYNAVDVNATANESFDLVILDSQSSSATNQNIIGSYSGITMSGTFSGPPNLFDAAYTSTESFTPTTDGVFHLGIHLNSSAGGDVFFVKEVLIEEQSLSINNFETLNFDYFVDSQNNLNLSASQSFEQVNLFNLLGQQVLSQKLNSQNESVNLNALSSGVYLGQVKIDGTAKTFKIVKK